MTELRFYADATALISLARIDRLDLLAALGNVVFVTDQVWREATGNPEKPGVRSLHEAKQLGLLAVVVEGDSNAFPDLDAGESSVISAAIAAEAGVILDERTARAWLDRHPELHFHIPRVTGLIGLLLVAKRSGLVTSVRPLLDDLMLHGFRISRRLYEQTLANAGEL